MAKATDDNPESIVKEAVREFVEAGLRGEQPDVEAFVGKYRGCESQIRKGIGELQRIDALFDSLTKADARDFEEVVDEPDLVGQKIRNFEVKEVIGRGGMGVVYLARDTRLNRVVAIKSIPAALQSEGTARVRFRREAQLLASLNHPNIGVIYDIIESDESGGYLILEYVAGETLSERIAREPLSLEETLSIGRQIAEAVSAAHQKGVVHRDLKPGNIKITPEGQVKVLDFGLAKAVPREGTGNGPTATEPGRVIGTPAYMSPEQARGKGTDKRSDIWSFGCLLYEMLTNKVLFKGETASDTLANILQTEPDWQALPESTPANIRVLLRRCLEKDPSQRLHDIADARIEIDETRSGASEAYARPDEAAAAPRLAWRNVAVVGVACLTVGIFIAGAILVHLPRPGLREPPVVSRFPIGLPEGKPLFPSVIWQTPLAISPDGTRVVYVGRGADQIRRLYVRYLDDLEVKLIPGTEDARNPFFSPNGNWVGFFTPPDTPDQKGKLKIVSLAGGEPVPLVAIPGTFGSWAEDGTIVFSVNGGREGLHRISEDGGTPEVILSTDREESWTRYPQVLPGSDAILYSRQFVTGGSCIEVLFPKTGRIERICENAHYARYIESGHLIFLRDYVLMAVPFDIERLKITGSFVDLIDRVQGDSKGHPPSIAVSRNGTMVHSAYVSKSDVSRPEMRKCELLWVDRQGHPEPVGAPAGSYAIARLSPDERQIALRVPEKGSSSIHVYDKQRGTVIPIVPEDGYRPVWSPDGRHIAFWSGNRQSVFRQVVGERGAAERLAREPFGGSWLWPHSWSPDGRSLACTLQFGKWDDIWILPLDGDRKPYPLLDRERLGEYNPAFSPDGQWLAYVLYDGAEEEVYLRQFPHSDGEIKVSSGGGIGPIWSRDGRELFYVNVKTRTMMAVPIGTDPNSAVGTPEELFTLEGPYLTAGNLARTYDVSSDGRFLMLKRVEDAEFRLICVHNWFEELKQLAPASKAQ